ncbi:MAG: NifB/NifX family molybdenum-iron cluster-binding protein [Patescibacteria group bacterium]
MIICLSTEQDNLDSLLSTHFEKAKYFIFFNTERREIDLIKNQGGIFRRSKAHLLVAEKRPNLVITGNIEPDSYDFLKASAIKIASGVFGISGREAVERYLHGRLREAEQIPGAGRGRIL